MKTLIPDPADPRTRWKCGILDKPRTTNITNIFGNWLNDIENNTKARIHIGVLFCVGRFRIAEIYHF
jgi:hypothetical protein